MQGVKKPNPRARRCPICSTPSKKKGFTKQGRQRWYCKECRYSFTATDHRQKHAQEAISPPRSIPISTWSARGKTV
ncbi:MAG: IS1/IS1595 family N-terminal zinc-binding domain-containing protein [Schaalia turicensis]